MKASAGEGAAADKGVGSGKRVLMLLENAHYPQDTRPLREAQTLVAAGYRVAIICPRRGLRDGKPQRWRENLDGVEVYRYPAPYTTDGAVGFLVEYCWAMVAIGLWTLYYFLRHGFDIIHAHNPPDTLMLIAAPYKLLGKRFVFDHHDLMPEMYHARLNGGGSAWVRRALVFFERLTCRLADHIIVVNESYKAMDMERSGIPEGRITVVRNGPDVSRLTPVLPDAELRGRAELIIGYIGELGPQDGLDYLLRTVRHLVYDLGQTSVLCVLIGQGPVLPALKTMAAELGIEQHVWFTGWISWADVVRYLITADICVDPDPSNPFTDRSTMLKMMEYMALGKPIVAFDLPEHRVTAQEAAVYVRPNGELEMARQIVKLAGDPARREEMSRFGRLRAQSELAWPHQEGALLEAYAHLGSSRVRGGRLARARE